MQSWGVAVVVLERRVALRACAHAEVFTCVSWCCGHATVLLAVPGIQTEVFNAAGCLDTAHNIQFEMLTFCLQILTIGLVCVVSVAAAGSAMYVLKVNTCVLLYFPLLP
jgi:hypothetical protein